MSTPPGTRATRRKLKWRRRQTTTSIGGVSSQPIFQRCRCRAAASYEGPSVKLGAAFTMSPTKVTGSTIAMLNDTCGNRIQIAALDRWQS